MSFLSRNLFAQARSSLSRQAASTSAWGIRHESSSAAAKATVASTSSTSESAPPTHYRITLRRSGIGMPEKINRTLQGLGLKKRLQSVYRPIGADMAGAILAVKELVHVENVRRLQQADQLLLSDEEAVWVNEAGEIVDPGKAAKKAPRGYKIVGNVVSELRDQQIKNSSSSA
ncbi:related to MRPL33-mitochondrial ribosomal protein, large subunit [Sporisorium reilianum f. sp. reilianum]|uniref:Large ribosomal subunit protein uL30m n=1 Tax=Sporisorium reilianum f. sp. reilianum TaxID=72559 RepID=A0A2N8U7C7_9BASI|nr:related to MRPL33-mitochondrial ribosomal protein, large subunit [Sporisorium reilianum f. sp. reilianum]